MQVVDLNQNPTLRSRNDSRPNLVGRSSNMVTFENLNQPDAAIPKKQRPQTAKARPNQLVNEWQKGPRVSHDVTQRPQSGKSRESYGFLPTNPYSQNTLSNQQRKQLSKTTLNTAVSASRAKTHYNSRPVLDDVTIIRAPKVTAETKRAITKHIIPNSASNQRKIHTRMQLQQSYVRKLRAI